MSYTYRSLPPHTKDVIDKISVLRGYDHTDWWNKLYVVPNKESRGWLILISNKFVHKYSVIAIESQLIGGNELLEIIGTFKFVITPEIKAELSGVIVSDHNKFPHKCKCGSAAYIGFSSTECSNASCQHYKG
jgi:hypothetical protein